MSYTKAQVGAANVPDAHTSSARPSGMTGIDLEGDEYATPPADQPRILRGFRAPAVAQTDPDIALGDKQSNRAAAHASKGSPDPRRTETALSGHQSGESSRFKPMDEHYVNVRENVTIEPEAAPTRPRAGWTGDDNTRTARFQHAHVMRPFDKGIAEHPGAVTKAGQPAPLAARPPERDALVGGLPSPMGSGSSKRAGIGVQPNSFRLMPRAWDALAINTGGPAVSASNPDPAQAAASHSARRGFRL